MKCVSEMQFMPLFCHLTVYSVPICCKILLGDVRRIVVAFTDDKIQETDSKPLSKMQPSLKGPKFSSI